MIVKYTSNELVKKNTNEYIKLQLSKQFNSYILKFVWGTSGLKY